MDKEQQRIAIAEHLGWRRVGQGWQLRPYVSAYTPEELPDYLADLNAMHEAEGTIYPNFETATDDQMRTWMLYRKQLNKAAMPDCQDGAGLDERLIRATAPQRAEAFLRTLNLWTDE